MPSAAQREPLLVAQLLLYRYVEGIVERREPFREQHLALIDRYADEGRLLLSGAVGAPPHLGLLAMREASDAAAFVAEDPYIAADLVTEWSVEPWSMVAGAMIGNGDVGETPTRPDD